MGQGLSSALFTADELVQLESFAGAKAWPLESEAWHTLLRFKTQLWTSDAAVVTAEVGAFAARLLAHDAESHNLATFAAHLASRLPSVFYFHRTDIEMTTSGVVRRAPRALRALRRPLLGLPSRLPPRPVPVPPPPRSPRSRPPPPAPAPAPPLGTRCCSAALRGT
jgi:hypothetical protein